MTWRTSFHCERGTRRTYGLLWTVVSLSDGRDWLKRSQPFAVAAGRNLPVNSPHGMSAWQQRHSLGDSWYSNPLDLMLLLSIVILQTSGTRPRQKRHIIIILTMQAKTDDTSAQPSASDVRSPRTYPIEGAAERAVDRTTNV